MNTPTLEQSFVHCEMIFEPRLVIGQTIALETSTGDNNAPGSLAPAGTASAPLSNVYKVTGFTHRGIISPVVGGELITEVTLAPGTFTLVA